MTLIEDWCVVHPWKEWLVWRSPSADESLHSMEEVSELVQFESQERCFDEIVIPKQVGKGQFFLDALQLLKLVLLLLLDGAV